jgi:glucose-6-phosphate isomerase
MLYKQILHSCFKEEDPNNLIKEQDFQTTKQQIKQSQDRLKQDISQQKIGSLNLNTDLDMVKNIAHELREKFRTLVIIGIGGSSLGGQTLCGTRFYQYFQNEGPNIVFLDNIHYLDFTHHLAPLNIETTGFLIISKSGTTLETITLATYITNHFRKIKEDISKNFYVITENTDNPLRNLGTKINATIIDHPKNIGGRYSCFSLVALIPAAICNIDIEGFIQGAKEVLDNFQSTEENFISDGAALLLTTEAIYVNETVFIPYIQKLSFLPSWYVQLFAESLGKNGKGIMPIKAMGSVDQHSVFQLFLDGPNNKSFTILTENIKNSGNHIIDDICAFKDIEYLQGHTLGDVIQAQQEAIIYALKSRHRPIREIQCETYSDRALGQIMMHFILEVILLGYAASINPFDQPAVEIGKKKTKEILLHLK